MVVVPELTPRQWLMLRLDSPPQVYVLRPPNARNGWQVVLRIDGGYGDKADAVEAGRALGREVFELWRGAHTAVDSDPPRG